jgi:hypothetical protein
MEDARTVPPNGYPVDTPAEPVPAAEALDEGDLMHSGKPHAL